jgi:hypothetical protein
MRRISGTEVLSCYWHCCILTLSCGAYKCEISAVVIVPSSYLHARHSYFEGASVDHAIPFPKQTWALFSSQKILQNFSDSPSHRIFRHMHETLNIDKK